VSAGRIKISVASLREEARVLLWLRVHRTWKTSALLRLLKVESRAQGACSKISKGIRGYKSSGGIVPCSRWEPDLEKFNQRKVVKRRILKRKRIDDLKLSSRSPKSRRPSDRGGAARELTRRRTEKSNCHCLSAIGVGECKDYMHVEIASRDSPN
jgi:hypothetical protein